MPLSAAIGQPLLGEIFQVLASTMSHPVFPYKTSLSQQSDNSSKCQVESKVKLPPVTKKKQALGIL